MGFTKIRLGLEEIFELIIKDETGRKIGGWRVLKRDFADVMQIVSKKHGINVRIKKMDKSNRDLDWLK